MSEAPTVFCPKEGKEVPVWYCVGSFVQQREPCPNVEKATVGFAHAEVECKLQKRRRTVWQRLKLLILGRI